MVDISGLYFTMHTYCNFSCTYCWQKNSPTLELNKKLNPNDIISIIDYFFESYFILYPPEKKITIVFSGGEGLFFTEEVLSYISHIREYENIIKANIKITIQTNGGLLTPKIIEDLKKYKVELFFSYDGPGQNITRNSYLKVKNNLTIASQNLPIMVNSVFTPETQHLIYDTYEDLKNTNIIVWGFGIDFLQDPQQYDKEIILEQIIKIQNNPSKIRIKNFEHQLDDKSWRNGIENSIHQISINQYGLIHPTNFIYTGKEHTEFFNFNFGDLKNGFNEKKFIEYCKEKKQILENIPEGKTTSLTPSLIVNNLFNSSSKFY